MTDRDLTELTTQELAAKLYDHLEATEQLPIDPTANRWLGEAQAAAEDIADGSAPQSVIRKRASQVQHLLESAGDTEHPDADAHVAAALASAEELLARDNGE